MKYILALLALVALIISPSALAQGQTTDKLAIDVLGKPTSTGLAPQVIARFAVIDKDKNVIINGYNGKAEVKGTLQLAAATQVKAPSGAVVTGTPQVAQAALLVALTGDDQVVTPGARSIIQLSSNNSTAANRTFTMSAAGAVVGQIYVLIGPATNACEMADTGIQKLSAAWTPNTDDTLTLLFDGTNFLEVARSAN